MLIVTPLRCRVPVKSSLVNWLPWSVLKISGRPYRESASSRASTQNSAERVRQPPRQHGTAYPVHDHHEVEEALGHRDVSYVRAPDLIDPLDRDPAEQVGVDLVGYRRLARVRPLVDRHQAGEPHQAPDPFAVDDMTLGRQPRCHPPRAVIRPRQVLPIDQRYDRAVLLADPGRPAVDRSARYRQQPALPRYRQCRGFALDQSAPFRPAHLPSFRDKKSFSTFSWPICRYRTSTCAAPAVSSDAAPPPSKTLAAPSSSCFFQA